MQEKLTKLVLSLQPNFEGVARFLGRKDDPSFPELRAKVLQRDNHTCRFCGFHAEKYQQIVNVDGDYTNNKVENLATACVFCMHCQLLGLRNTNAKIIFLPEMSQIELNHFVRVLFCASIMHAEFTDIAKTLFQSFRKRSDMVEEVFGAGSSDSLVFAQSLIDVDPEIRKKKSKAMASLRLLPARNYYRRQIDYWAHSIITPEKIEKAITLYHEKMQEAH